jgi:predicted lipoprotein with Yx(FWY)xxD motif
MKTLPVMFLALLALVGCGGDDGASGADRAATTEAATPAAKSPAGTAITVRNSDFGTMLFGPNRQAVYIFQRDRRNLSRCYGDCARLWPPVYTDGRPRARGGARASLLGTIKRRDGRRQVTYAGKPLYYYAHEGPGEVECHNVYLNGGYWWVVGPSGKRRA